MRDVLGLRTPTFGLGDAVAAARETAIATGMPCTLLDRSGQVVFPVRLREYPCRMCRLAHGGISGTRVLAADHLEKARQADGAGGYQIFICPSNLMHWAAPIRAGGRMVGALVGGPVRLEGGDAEFESDILQPMRRTSEVVARAEESSLRGLYDRIAAISATRIESLARQLQRLASGLGGDGRDEAAQKRLDRESRINEYIQELKRYRFEHGMQAGIPTYPLETEQALLDAIAAGEGERAQAILNELLGHVFFTLGADLERIKVRAREIVILLSRIVIARGAEADRVFGYNYQVLDELDGLGDLADVAHWMARIVRAFAGSVLRIPTGAPHTAMLRKVLDYVEDGYRGRVTLAAASRIAGVSSGFLSRVFSAEMGETFTAYVRRIRIQRAQDLLTGTRLPIADIADLTGFADQSHLTAAFRRQTGTTPAEFRKRR